jgi:hypothetical protein
LEVVKDNVNRQQEANQNEQQQQEAMADEPRTMNGTESNTASDSDNKIDGNVDIESSQGNIANQTTSNDEQRKDIKADELNNWRKIISKELRARSRMVAKCAAEIRENENYLGSSVMEETNENVEASTVRQTAETRQVHATDSDSQKSKTNCDGQHEGEKDDNNPSDAKKENGVTQGPSINVETRANSEAIRSVFPVGSSVDDDSVETKVVANESRDEGEISLEPESSNCTDGAFSATRVEKTAPSDEIPTKSNVQSTGEESEENAKKTNYPEKTSVRPKSLKKDKCDLVTPNLNQQSSSSNDVPTAGATTEEQSTSNTELQTPSHDQANLTEPRPSPSANNQVDNDDDTTSPQSLPEEDEGPVLEDRGERQPVQYRILRNRCCYYHDDRVCCLCGFSIYDQPPVYIRNREIGRHFRLRYIGLLPILLQFYIVLILSLFEESYELWYSFMLLAVFWPLLCLVPFLR